jgi:pyruvate/2-oxoglutarate dehydrogenase complex dihydrolipoamide dehydrogenase (E3) component
MTQAHEQYDAIIIGVGQAGWKTAVIERHFVGGTCVNDGCTTAFCPSDAGGVAQHVV